jgi:hypothetical protein
MRTIAPNLLSSIHNSKYLDGSSSKNNPSSIVTIAGISSRGKKKKKGLYDTDIMMETLVDDGTNDVEEGNGRRPSAGGSSRTTIMTPEHGITKTQTTHVQSNVDRIPERDKIGDVEWRRERSMF